MFLFLILVFVVCTSSHKDVISIQQSADNYVYVDELIWFQGARIICVRCLQKQRC